MSLRPLAIAFLTVVAACGPRPPAQESQVRRKATPSDTLTARLAVDVDSTVSLALRVDNGTAHTVEIDFPSGHTHEFTIEDSVGREVWTSSDGRLFTQAMQNKVLGRERSVLYEAAWDPAGHHGRFTVIATLRSSSHPVEQRAVIDLP